MVTHPVPFRLRHSQHNQSPPVTKRGFSNICPHGNFLRFSQKNTNLEEQPKNEGCGFLGAEPSLAPSWFWVPCTVAVTLQRWASVTSLNKAPSTQISSFGTWNAAELLPTWRQSWEQLPLGSNKWVPDHGLKFPGNSTAVFSCSDSICAHLRVRGEQTHLGPCAQGLLWGSATPLLSTHSCYTTNVTSLPHPLPLVLSLPSLRTNMIKFRSSNLKLFFSFILNCIKETEEFCPSTFQESHLIPIKSNIPIYGVSF